MREQISCAMPLVLSVAALPLASTVNAADTLEEVLVTATKREERLQDVPISVSAMSGDVLTRVGAKELADYYAYVPSVNAAHNMVGERGGQNIIIRGVSNSRTIVTTDSSMLSATTGFYINDVPITPVDTQLFDVDRVEVLRGPQGTLYGAASMGGAVKLHPRRVDLYEFGGTVEATLSTISGGGEGSDFNGVLNLPIVEGVLGARFVGTYRTRDGFVDSIIIPRSTTVPNTTYPLSSAVSAIPSVSSARIIEDANSAESKGARIAVLYTPNDQFTVDASVLWQRSQSDDLTLFNTAYRQPMIQEKYILEPTISEMTLTSLNMSYDFGPVALHSVTGIYNRKYDETVDYSLVAHGTRAPGLDYIPATSALQTLAEWDTYTQEIRLQSNSRDQDGSFLSRLGWVVGGFWMTEDRANWQLADAPGWGAAAPLNPFPLPNDLLLVTNADVEDGNKALFAEFTFEITQQLIVGAGIRWFELTSDFDGANLPGDPGTPMTPRRSVRSYKEDGHTPKVFAQFKQSEDLMFYASYAEGFRLGGSTTPINFAVNPECESVVNDNGLAPFAGGQFFSDSVATTELGVKSTLNGGRLTVNASAYRTDWTDLQQQIRLTGFPGSLCTSVLTGNVGSAQIDGYELELGARLGEGFAVKGTVSYTDARIIDPGAGVAIARAGDPFPNVPEWSASVMADYSVPTNALGGGTFFMHGDLRYMSESVPVLGVLPSPLLNLPSYTMVGLRTGFAFGDKPLTVTLFANNVFDDIVHLNARARVGVASNIIVAPAMPRTIGVSIRKDF